MMSIENRSRSSLRRIGVVLAAGGSALALSALSAGSASALTPTAAPTYERSIGSCSAGDHSANVLVLYRNSGDRHDIAYVGWELTGGGEPIGTDNRIVARVKDDNSLGHDPIYYTYRSPGGIGTEDGFRFDDEVSVPARKRMYVEFTVTFDVPDGDDETCVAHTRNV